ncbi:transposase [Streptomyces violascens]
MGDNVGRVRSEALFAALCGASPVEYSSGGRCHRPLNRGGNRQANAALYRIVLTRLRWDPRTQAYYERRVAEGKTRREIIRCLKRYVAREASIWCVACPQARCPYSSWANEWRAPCPVWQERWVRSERRHAPDHHGR